ncbi:MAG: cyclase [Chloroflexi bacterium]|nr:cyclase [Chloroflexota bacterium]MCL5951703.1 cyclase [Chloroflexota bacterium]
MEMEEYLQKPVTKPDAVRIERIASLIGGGVLLSLALARRSPASIPLALLGGGLVYHGASDEDQLARRLRSLGEKGTGTSISVPHGHGICVEKSVIISRSSEELYNFWRNLENLPRFMHHLESVHMLDDRRSHWVAKAPAGTQVQWDAEIINDIPNQLIAWRSLEGSDIPNAGSVHFDRTPSGRGTIVKAELQYEPPAGPVGAAFAKLFGDDPSRTVYHDLRRFKQLIETGEVASTEGQPTGSRNVLSKFGVGV